MNFEDAWALTMSWEGGSLLHTIAGDPGGTTRYGLSQRAYPDLDLEALTEEDAQGYAMRDYWLQIRAPELPGELRWHVFDMAFNAGTDRAIRVLQKSLNLHSASRDGSSLEVDGQFGPKTLVVSQCVLQIDKLVRIYKAYRVYHYIRVAETRLPQFIDGWLRRAEGEYNG